jgi:hypothetical protein
MLSALWLIRRREAERATGLRRRMCLLCRRRAGSVRSRLIRGQIQPSFRTFAGEQVAIFVSRSEQA